MSAPGVLLSAFVALGAPCAPGALQDGGAAQEQVGGQDALLLRERMLGVMGSDLELKLLGADELALERALDAAEKEIRRVEDLMTDWRPSPLTSLNERAGEGPVQVPEELARLVARSLELGRVTEGAFDITYAGAGRLWDFKAEPPRLPEPAAIEAALSLIDYRRLEVDLEARTVTIPARMRIGLGGIAKGYGVDRAMQVLLDQGVQHAMVSAGGDLKVLGLKFGEPWQIAVRHPRDRERVLAVLPVSNTCVMTSGDYERFFDHDGKRYHHILDPRTGYPATGCMSATVVAQDAAYGDALATALCVLGPERGLPIIEGLPRTEAVLVGLDGKVTVSSGLKAPAAR